MKAVAAALLFGGVMVVGIVTMRRQNQEKRRVLAQLDGHEVVLEFRTRQGSFTTERAGTIRRSKSAASVELHTRGALTDKVRIAAIRSIRELPEGMTFGPWK